MRQLISINCDLKNSIKTGVVFEYRCSSSFDFLNNFFNPRDKLVSSRHSCHVDMEIEDIDIEIGYF